MYYDVVIVGAGPGGAITAKTLDDSNLSVCLIDSKPKKKIGEKVCGDLVEKSIFDFLHERINLEYPKDEIRDKIEGIKVFSPDRKTIFDLKTNGGGYTLNRLKFGQHLIDQLKNINLMDNTRFKGFYEKGVVVKKNMQNEKIECKIVVDASGFGAVVRKMINNEVMEKNIALRDIAICYREIRKYEFEDPHYCHIYLGNRFSPGGYVWEFSENEYLNVGVGVLYPSIPKKQYDKYIKFRGEKFLKSEIINAGGGVVPTRRPIDSLVATHNGIGIMVVGDAGCQANPIHGGGIEHAMKAGYFAGITIKKIFEKYNVCEISLNDLWEYNFYYMRNYGGTMASLDLFRIFLQSLSDEEISAGMSAGLIQEEDLIKFSEERKINVCIIDKIIRIVKSLAILNITKKLAYTIKKMKEIKEVYENYPSPEKFHRWKENVKIIYKDIYSISNNNP